MADIEFGSEGVITQNLCGGSILAANIILTAAHCVVRDVAGRGSEEPQDQLYHPIQVRAKYAVLINRDSIPLSANDFGADSHSPSIANPNEVIN